MIRFCAGLLGVLLVTGTAAATIDYTVSLAKPEEHIFRVTMQVSEVRDSAVVQMPAWNALYQIRDFAQRVQQFRARAEGGAVEVLKLDKQTWRIVRAPGAQKPLGMVTVEYGVYWDEAGPFSTQLDANHAFVNFAMVLLYVPEQRAETVRVRFADVPEGWEVAAALPRGETSSTLRAANYDALADAPVEISRFEDARFEVANAKIRVVVHGTEWDRPGLRNAVERIVAYQVGLMREVPFSEFVFLFHFGVGGGGGMEHANSTAISFSANAPPAGVTAHEFFHLWNVKRIRPGTLEPVDYTRENWTRALWFAEGVTSTYGSFTLVRSGLWSREQFYDNLAAEITTLESRPARLWQSVEQSSLDAWLERYPGYGRPDLSISYYNKGQILGFLLDVLIRDATDNRRSFDDVLRYLNAEFAHKGRFYADSADIRSGTEKIAGRDFGDFFRRYVAGTDELPCAETLARAGLELTAREGARADFGFAVSRSPGASLVGELRAGTPAAAAGIRSGDLLLELEGGAFPGNAGRWLRERQPGDEVRLRLRHGTEEREVKFALASRGEMVYTLRELAGAGERQQRIREGMLNGTTTPDATPAKP